MPFFSAEPLSRREKPRQHVLWAILELRTAFSGDPRMQAVSGLSLWLWGLCPKPRNPAQGCKDAQAVLLCSRFRSASAWRRATCAVLCPQVGLGEFIWEKRPLFLTHFPGGASSLQFAQTLQSSYFDPHRANDKPNFLPSGFRIPSSFPTFLSTVIK